jgi:hypothetical protein
MEFPEVQFTTGFFKLNHYLEFANGNEREALDLFFEDLEAYHSESSRAPAHRTAVSSNFLFLSIKV